MAIDERRRLLKRGRELAQRLDAKAQPMAASPDCEFLHQFAIEASELAAIYHQISTAAWAAYWDCEAP